jgi:hypothetical protein
MSPDSFGVCTTPEVTLNKAMGKQNHHTTPSFPFKDSNGVTVRGCRREIPDRRINSIQAEWIDEVVTR